MILRVPVITTILPSIFNMALPFCKAEEFQASHSQNAVHVEVDMMATISGVGDKEVLPASEDLSKDTKKQPECGIWLAPSTIPGAGLGIFAGQDYSQGDYLLPTGDIVIPLVDMTYHGSQYESGDWNFLWDEYTWNAEGLHMHREGIHEVNSASPGFGSAANCFLPIYNVDEGVPNNDPAGLHRSKDAGAGAFSTYYNRQTTALRDIGEGEELYATYGANWFESRPQLGPVPLHEHLDLAHDLATRYSTESKDSSAPMEVWEEVWKSFVKETAFTDSRTIGAFHHDDPEELRILEEMSMTDLRIKQSARSREWLEEHGACGDHITVKQSTIRQAGRGAFSRRFLPEGTVVAPLPMIHITQKERLAIYRMDYDDDGKLRPFKELGKWSYQVLYNYCYGHDESSIVLCPYGTLSSHVNHNKTLANVALRWSDSSRGNHMPHLLENSIEKLEEDATAKLAMEMVAIRDIEPGEEIFLDYGDAWQLAWEQHVANWKPVEGAETYKAAWQFNEDMTSRLKTEFEALEDTAEGYPENVELRCDTTFLREGWKDAYKSRTMDEFVEENDGYRWPCDILRYKRDRIMGEFLYTVSVWDEDDETYHLIKDIPRHAFHFMDTPYTSDMFLENAFRHSIGIPDHLFPEAWKNLSPKQEEGDKLEGQGSLMP